MCVSVLNQLAETTDMLAIGVLVELDLPIGDDDTLLLYFGHVSRAGSVLAARQEFAEHATDGPEQ